MAITLGRIRVPMILFLIVVGLTPRLAAEDRKPAATKATIARNKDKVPPFTNKHFEAPIRLTVGNEPLNKAAGQMYPSPAVYDVDNDGDVELVVGDISGRIYVYENKNKTGKGDPLWSSHAALKTAKGKQIRVSNW